MEAEMEIVSSDLGKNGNLVNYPRGKILQLSFCEFELSYLLRSLYLQKLILNSEDSIGGFPEFIEGTLFRLEKIIEPYIAREIIPQIHSAHDHLANDCQVG